MKYFLARLTKAGGCFFQILACGLYFLVLGVGASQKLRLICFMVDQTGSVHLSELAVMLNDGNKSSPGTIYVTSQSAASGMCV